MSRQDKVREFMRAAHLQINGSPGLYNVDLLLRSKLLLEEALEFCEACGYDPHVNYRLNTASGKMDRVVFWGRQKRPPDMVKMIDALIDVDYISEGSKCSIGIEGDAYFDEVHAANMCKLVPEVNMVDGKVIKPEGWQPPDIRKILDVEIAKHDK